MFLTIIFYSLDNRRKSYITCETQSTALRRRCSINSPWLALERIGLGLQLSRPTSLSMDSLFWTWKHFNVVKLFVNSSWQTRLPGPRSWSHAECAILCSSAPCKTNDYCTCIDVRSLFLISFVFENERSALQLLIISTRYFRSAISTLGNDSWTRFLCIS